MKHVNQKAKRIMDKLTKGLNPETPTKKFDNRPGTFMAVHVEYLKEIPFGSFFSVSHYYEQNGDLMRDPDMEFLRGHNGNYYPAYFRQDGAVGIEQEVFVYGEDGQIKQFKPRLMNDLKNFANTWMENIRQQQEL